MTPMNAKQTLAGQKTAMAGAPVKPDSGQLKTQMGAANAQKQLLAREQKMAQEQAMLAGG